MYDIEALLDAADSLTVANYLGMEVVKKGAYHFIKCPGHASRLGRPDNKIGNCVLTPKGYHCFACQERASVVTMVMEYEQCTFPQALKIIGEACGGAFLFETDSSTKVREKRQSLTPDDIALIGLCPFAGSAGDAGRLVINASAAKPKTGDWYEKNGEYIMYTRGARQSLQQLFLENESAYNILIRNKSEEAMRRYESAIEEFGARNSAGAGRVYNLFNDGGYVDGEVFSGIKNALQEKYWRAREIFEIFSEKVGRFY